MNLARANRQTFSDIIPLWLNANFYFSIPLPSQKKFSKWKKIIWRDWDKVVDDNETMWNVLWILKWLDGNSQKFSHRFQFFSVSSIIRSEIRFFLMFSSITVYHHYGECSLYHQQNLIQIHSHIRMKIPLSFLQQAGNVEICFGNQSKIFIWMKSTKLCVFNELYLNNQY